MARRPDERAACCAGRDIHDASRVADHLGIPHYVIDAEQRFARAVIDDFAAAYAAGETPVPCVRCNQTVKFADLTALARGSAPSGWPPAIMSAGSMAPDGPELHRARDAARDQSWFLFATTRRSSASACSRWATWRTRRRCVPRRCGWVAGRGQARQPGHLLRPRRALRRAGRSAASGCAAAGGHRRSGRRGARPARGDRPLHGRPGEAARRRLDAADWWCTALDATRRRIVVGPRVEGTRAVQLGEMNWLIATPGRGLRCTAKLRAREAPQPARVEPCETGAAVLLDTPALAGTWPGLRAV